jgi:hypothetical protein
MTLSARELSLLSNTDVLGYIQAQNAKRDAQAKAEGWEFWTNMAEDIASEFANVYELELSFARGTYADVYKDWCGLPGYVSDELTLEQVEAAIGELYKDLSADMLAEDIREEYWADLEEEEAAQVEEEEWEVYETKAEAEGY